MNDEQEHQQEPEQESKGPGRPITRIIKLDATPEEVARAIFAAAPPPDPSRRKHKSSGDKEG